MRLHCLGTTGYHPNCRQHTACYFIADTGTLLDAGTGLFRLSSLLRNSPLQELDILLSHAHLDHVVGLTFLIDVMAMTELRTVRVYGTSDKLQAVREHLFHPLLFPVPPSFSFHEIAADSEPLVLPQAEVDFFSLEHPGGSVGMLLRTPSKKIAYITDTTPLSVPEWEERLEGVDLLLHECYFSDNHADLALRTGHCWLSAVTKLVEAVRPKQTLLIHTNPQAELMGETLCLDSRHRDLGIRLAEDLLCIDF
jgi:ribonuclease Z